MKSTKNETRGFSEVPVIAFCNQKGGTGKTTLTQIAIPYFASVQGLRVCVIDSDPQCNLTLRYLDGRRHDSNQGYIPPPHPDHFDPDFSVLFDDKDYCSICDIFTMGGTIPYKTEVDNVSIVPADGFELERINAIAENNKHRVVDAMKTFVQSLRESGDYDIILIDTPPNKQAVSEGAIYCATDAFPVIVPESKSIEGLLDVMMLFNRLNDHKARTKNKNDIEVHGETVCRGIVINKYMYNSRTVHDSVLKFAADPKDGFGDLLLKTKLCERVDLKLVDLHGANPNNPFACSPKSAVYKECLAVFDEIWDRLGFEHTQARYDFDGTSNQTISQ